MNADISALLILPRLSVQSANAISGPLTWGFPAPSAFTGFTHALSRRIRRELRPDIYLQGVGIVCHEFSPQVSSGYVKSFRLTRNPVSATGEPRAFVEEGRTHLTVSLIMGLGGEGVIDIDEDDLPEFAQRLGQLAQMQRLAGGSILANHESRSEVRLLPDDSEEREKDWRRVRRRLLPGFVLVGRDDLLQQHLDELRKSDANSTPLDALLDVAALHWDCDIEGAESDARASWHVRPRVGWLVPIPLGYSAISPLYAPGEVRNARDEQTAFRFVESMYGLGEWLSPHRIHHPFDFFWHDQADPDSGLYRCTNSYALTQQCPLQGD